MEMYYINVEDVVRILEENGAKIMDIKQIQGTSSIVYTVIKE